MSPEQPDAGLETQPYDESPKSDFSWRRLFGYKNAADIRDEVEQAVPSKFGWIDQQFAEGYVVGIEQLGGRNPQIPDVIGEYTRDPKVDVSVDAFAMRVSQTHRSSDEVMAALETMYEDEAKTRMQYEIADRLAYKEECKRDFRRNATIGVTVVVGAEFVADVPKAFNGAGAFGVGATVALAAVGLVMTHRAQKEYQRLQLVKEWQGQFFRQYKKCIDRFEKELGRKTRGERHEARVYLALGRIKTRFDHQVY